MNKIGKIIIGIVLLLVVVGLGLFCWQKWQQKQEENLGYIQFNEFTKQEVGSDVYFENKESGLKFKVPTGWNAIASQLASIALTSPDFVDFKETDLTRSHIAKTGCWIGVSVKKTLSDDGDYSAVKDYLTYQNFIDTNTTKHKIINLSGKKALETDYLIDSESNAGDIIVTQYISNNKLYSIESDFFGKDNEKCHQSFADFLNTISIK